MPRKGRSLNEKIQEADVLAGRYLGNANEAEERGDKEKAAKRYDKAQYWLDRLNKLNGDG
jgi:hypothetical protein